MSDWRKAAFMTDLRMNGPKDCYENCTDLMLRLVETYDTQAPTKARSQDQSKRSELIASFEERYQAPS